ncbi:hypothetical protein Tco_0249223, partial [Tanacetum coccineum]
ILGISNEEAGLKVDISKKDSKGTSGVSPLDSMSAKNKSIVNHTTRIEDIKAKQPRVTIVAVDESKPRDQTAGSSSYSGSRMMAKLGYIDDNGQKAMGEKLLALKFVESVTLLYTADPSASSELLDLILVLGSK